MKISNLLIIPIFTFCLANSSCSSDSVLDQNEGESSSLRSTTSKHYIVNTLSPSCSFDVFSESGILQDVDIYFSEPLAYDAIISVAVYRRNGIYLMHPYDKVEAKKGEYHIVLKYSCMPSDLTHVTKPGIARSEVPYTVQVTDIKYTNGKAFDYSRSNNGKTTITANTFIDPMDRDKESSYDKWWKEFSGSKKDNPNKGNGSDTGKLNPNDMFPKD